MKNQILIIVLVLAVIAQGCNGNNSDKSDTPLDNAGATATGKFLIMSDVHFNPFCDPSIVDQLTKTDYKGWQKVFESSSDSSYGPYGTDSYYRLMVSAFEEMQKRNSNPDMIIINGDFICHQFESVFLQHTGETNRDSLRSFIRKTVSFVFLMLDQHFPNTPVLPVLGNNDDYCGDYHIQPDGPFLSFFAGQTKPLLRNMQQSDYLKTFSKGGYYKVAMPWDDKTVFIGLNTIYFSTNYANVCDSADTANAGWDEFNWLKKTLADCKSKGEDVWLSYHIPPGMDIYKSSKAKPCGAHEMWKQPYNDSFLNLVNRYSDIIKGNFAGHTHMDEFRIISDGKKLTSFVHITPAISPIFDNNPGFVEITWDPKKLELINSVTYRFKGIQTKGDNTWAEEYNYGKTYNIPAINAKTLAKIWKKMETDSATRAHYMHYYFVNNPAEIPTPWKAYWCGARFLRADGFVKCNCQ